MNTASPMLFADQILADIAVFADIGTEPPSIHSAGSELIIRFMRNGDPTELVVSSNGFGIVERFGTNTNKYSSFKSLLASDRFGALREWSARQLAYISQESLPSGTLLEVYGTLNGNINQLGIDDIDKMLVAHQENDSTRILLIDGPAGIGKTQFILSLAERRVRRYSIDRHPLILHIQSRGRTLSYLYDLIAFSLQRLRIPVTFDQVPILAKHGLITIAIDGFDELADPDGYDLAWSQVSDLIRMLRGTGSLILAGRETFIGRERVLKDIASVRDGIDDVSVLTLQPPTKTSAINWLESEGWTDQQVSLIEGFLEPSSLALRPFFLKTLSDPTVAAIISSTSATSVLSILMQAMIEREIDKFGEAVDRELTRIERRTYLHTFVGEVARDIAESGTSSISDATLSWLVEASLPKQMSDNVVRILKARSQFIAFFTNDDRPGYRRFFHEKFYEYFLSQVIVDIVGKSETGKLLGRSIIGSSLLETFVEVISSATHTDQVRTFISQTLRLLREYPPIDRTRKNLAALAIASLSTADLVDDFQVSTVDVDECRFTGTASGGFLDSLLINQFDCRGGNLSTVEFCNITLLTLIADRDTLLPDSFPTPTRIQDIAMGGRTLTSPVEVQKWINTHRANPPEIASGLIPEGIRDHEAIKLLHRACRLRQYWLRRGDDVYASRILENQYWPMVEASLLSSDLLRVEMRQASGNDARFVHVRHAAEILSEDASNDNVVRLYSTLSKQIKEEQ